MLVVDKSARVRNRAEALGKTSSYGGRIIEEPKDGTIVVLQDWEDTPTEAMSPNGLIHCRFLISPPFFESGYLYYFFSGHDAKMVQPVE